MLSTRSARLAATLLLTLLFGWTVRSCRKGATTVLPAPAPTMPTPAQEITPQAFSDE